MASPGPTLASFTAFVRSAGFSAEVVPDNSVWLKYALANALAIVNQALRIVALPTKDAAGVPISDGRTIYEEAVYNLGTDNLVNYAPDLEGAPVVKGSEPPQQMFAYLRTKWNILGFVSGVIQSANDEGTGESMVVQEAAKNFTLSDLQNLKTPWGRTYLGLAQMYGPSTWGIS